MRFVHSTVVVAGLVVGLLGANALTPVTAHAYPEYANLRYGLTQLPSPYIDDYECTDCHVNTNGGDLPCGVVASGHPFAPCFNPFGIAYRTSGWSNALRDADSDGDGTTNGNELLDSTADDPAGSAGFPVGAEAFCDMLSCADATGAAIGCSSDIRCQATRSAGPASTGTNPTSNSYSFSFTCEPGTGPLPVNSDTNWNDRCLDINECSGNPCSPGSCAQRPLAGWTSPGYDCTCGAGYLDNGTACQLVDACTAGTDNCAGVSSCVDTPGNSAVFTCVCPHAGYSPTGTNCANINECTSDPCGPNDSGTGPSGNGCTERALGAWTAPGYDCACAGGYGSNGTTCVLENECTAGTDDCVALATCFDPTTAPNNFLCTCPAGYLGNGRASGTGCVDVDECALGLDNCDVNATCGNTPGSFTCTCNAPGWVGTGVTCSDYDECADPVFLATCDPNATCANLVGSYQCNCIAGYRGTGFVCAEIDECAEASDDCHADATCTNTPAGSFSCACNAGYSGDGRTCGDVDECIDPVILSGCSTASTCNNLPGDYECVCNAGYRGDGVMCADIDECMEASDTCAAEATCTNQIGNYSCACDAGWEGSGFVCVDENECALGTHGCALNEVCVNNVGAVNTCVCRPGFGRLTPDGECEITCGDGAVAPGEQCDDGNVLGGDGCNPLCDVEAGWACVEPTDEASICTNTCGDGLVQMTEECDDGPANSDTVSDACRASCVAAACGDGTVDTGEACDDGASNTDSGVDGCRTDCNAAYCGDGVIDSGEVCDLGGGLPGAALAETCTTACAPDAGIDPEDPPALTGGACRAAPGAPSGGLPAGLAFLLVGLAFAVRRRS